MKTHQVAKRQTTQLQKVGRRREQTLQQACTLAVNGHGRRRTLSGQKPRALEAEPRTRTHVPATCAAADGRAAGTSTSETAASVCVKWAHWRPRDSIPRHRQQKCTHVYTQRHVETVTALSCGLRADATTEHTSLSRRSRAMESSLHLRQAQNWQGCHRAEEGVVGGQATPSSPRHWHWHPSVRAQSLQGGTPLCVPIRHLHAQKPLVSVPLLKTTATPAARMRRVKGAPHSSSPATQGLVGTGGASLTLTHVHKAHRLHSQVPPFPPHPPVYTSLRPSTPPPTVTATGL